METLRRKPERGQADRHQLDSFLDSQWWGVLSVARTPCPAGRHDTGAAEPGGDGAGALRSVPTLFVRDGDRLLLHGSTGAGVMGTHGSPAAPVQASFCVTAMDALVVAHSTFDSSVRYRSAVLYGPLEEAAAEDRWTLLERFSELLLPGRTSEVRAMTRKEVAATNVLSLPIAKGSWVYKVNASPVAEPEEETDAWAGLVPFTSGYGEPERAAWSDAPLPDSVRRLTGPAGS